MNQDASQQHGSYTVKTINGCRIVFGSVPMSELSHLTKGYSKKALMASDIASRIGAAFVIGEPDDIQGLRSLNLPVSQERHIEYQLAIQSGRSRLAKWLRDGERCDSSNAMAKRIFGIPLNAGATHPHDPSDLKRCLDLIDQTDAHVWKMGDVSAQWAALISAWSDLVSLLEMELERGTRAPKTLALMQDLLDPHQMQ